MPHALDNTRVSGELSSMEINNTQSWDTDVIMFQENLVVWKFNSSIFTTQNKKIVSGELSSMEIFIFCGFNVI